MKITLDTNKWRIRVTEQQLADLLDGSAIALQSPLLMGMV